MDRMVLYLLLLAAGAVLLKVYAEMIKRDAACTTRERDCSQPSTRGEGSE